MWHCESLLLLLLYMYIIYSLSIISSNWYKIYQFLTCGPLDLKDALTSAYSQVKVFKFNSPQAMNWYIFCQFELTIEKLSNNIYIHSSYIYTVFLLSVRPDNKYIRTKNVDHRLWRSFDKCIHFESKYVNLVVRILRPDIFIVRTDW